MVNLGRITDQTTYGTCRRNTLDNDFTFIGAILQCGGATMDTTQAAVTGTLLHQLAIVLAVDQFLDGAFRCCIIGTFCFHRALSGDTGQVVIDGIFGNKGAFLIQKMKDKLVEHKQYIAEYGEDLPEIRNWKWTPAK